jgi:FkbM family methyltransferase
VVAGAALPSPTSPDIEFARYFEGQMMFDTKKLVRTIQTELPVLQRPKEWVRHQLHWVTRTPHDRDFAALKLLPVAADELILDIGANHGQSIASIRLFRPDCQLIAFEPNPVLAGKLSRHAKGDPNLEIRAFGLGAEIGSFRLFIPSYNGWVYDGLASFDRDEAANWISQDTIYAYRPKLLRVEECVCEVRTLDAQKLSPGFIKIDVQGLEYDVLKGGLETLKRSSPILMVEQFGTDKRLTDLVSSLGYVPYSFDGSRLRTEPSRTSNTFLVPTARKISALAVA